MTHHESLKINHLITSLSINSSRRKKRKRIAFILPVLFCAEAEDEAAVDDSGLHDDEEAASSKKPSCSLSKLRELRPSPPAYASQSRRHR